MAREFGLHGDLPTFLRDGVEHKCAKRSARRDIEG